MKKNHIHFDYTLWIIALTAVIMLLMIACDEKDPIDSSKYYCDTPTGFAATLLSNDRRVHLTWNEVSNAKHYEISFRTNLDSADTRRNAGTSTITRYEHSYYSYWNNTTDVTTLYYYVKTHPSISGYIASDWSRPVSVKIR